MLWNGRVILYVCQHDHCYTLYCVLSNLTCSNLVCHTTRCSILNICLVRSPTTACKIIGKSVLGRVHNCMGQQLLSCDIMVASYYVYCVLSILAPSSLVASSPGYSLFFCVACWKVGGLGMWCYVRCQGENWSRSDLIECGQVEQIRLPCPWTWATCACKMFSGNMRPPLVSLAWKELVNACVYLRLKMYLRLEVYRLMASWPSPWRFFRVVSTFANLPLIAASMAQTSPIAS